MNLRTRILPAALVASALVGCTPPASGASSASVRPSAVAALSAEERAEAARAVRAADEAWARAAAGHDLEGSVAAIAPEGVMLPPDGPPIVGRAAVREYMRQAFAIPGFAVTWTTDTVIVSAAGDLAYSFARSRYIVPKQAGAGLDTLYAKGLAVWRRTPAGRWEVMTDIWNAAPQLPPIVVSPSGGAGRE